jgi:hypothetical protein
VLRYVNHVDDGGAEMFGHAAASGREGIVSKSVGCLCYEVMSPRQTM